MISFWLFKFNALNSFSQLPKRLQSNQLKTFSMSFYSNKKMLNEFFSNLIIKRVWREKTHWWWENVQTYTLINIFGNFFFLMRRKFGRTFTSEKTPEKWKLKIIFFVRGIQRIVQRMMIIKSKSNSLSRTVIGWKYRTEFFLSWRL